MNAAESDHLHPALSAVAVAPSPEAAHEMGAVGGQPDEAERLAFEAWMKGHCWPLCATWKGAQYVGDAEHPGYICPQAMATRRMWAAWRDRAALARAATVEETRRLSDLKGSR